ncbi:MAG: amidohydrolase family protein [Armatimonadota bacterium]|nr:amidohydrolase family protein [Armatimonadota bacterium]
MRIIDAHAHLGKDPVFDVDFTEESLLEAQESNGINITLVQPPTVHDLEGVRQCHDAIADLSRRFPGRFYGICCPNPHLPGTQFQDEVRRCIEELGFVALKLHPFGHAVNPLGTDGKKVFETASRLGIPVMVHTGPGIPWTLPSLLRPVAEDYPNLKIVVAHAGHNILSAEAGLLAEQCSNVYLEPSWVSGLTIESWVKTLGAHRIMFGSDHGENAATELAKYRSMKITAEELAMILGGTAGSVFGIQ